MMNKIIIITVLAITLVSCAHHRRYTEAELDACRFMILAHSMDTVVTNSVMENDNAVELNPLYNDGNGFSLERMLWIKGSGIAIALIIGEIWPDSRESVYEAFGVSGVAANMVSTSISGLGGKK